MLGYKTEMECRPLDVLVSSFSTKNLNANIPFFGQVSLIILRGSYEPGCCLDYNIVTHALRLAYFHAYLCFCEALKATCISVVTFCT
jgi:hypothetical protein